MLEVVVVGGYLEPLTTNKPLGVAAVDGRTPPDTVRCTSYVTQPLGFWSF
jgi:hypothetical protein